MRLRPYQKDCLNLMTRIIDGDHGVVLPTGAGKTVIFSEFIKYNLGKSFLIIVHRDELVEQVSNKLKDNGILFSIEKASKRASSKHIALMTEKIKRKKEKYKESLALREMEKSLLETSIEKRNIKRESFEEGSFRAKKLDKTITDFNQRIDSINRFASKEKEIMELEADEMTNVVVATAQSLHAGRISEWDKNIFDYIIFDEAHHLRSDSWNSIRNHFNSIRFGFSATWSPREDKFNPLFKLTIDELISQQYLARPFQIRKDFTHLEIRNGTKDHDELILNAIFENPSEKTIVFASSVAQANRINETLVNNKFISGCVTADTPKDVRKRIIKNFKEAKYGCLINFLIFFEGFDVPDATMIVAKNTEEKESYIQAAGRGLRITRNKKAAKILDIITRKEQCSAPVLFGLASTWVPKNNDLLKDYLDAKKYADSKRKTLNIYESWDSLMGNHKEMEPRVNTKIKPKTEYKKLLGDSAKITSYNSKYATAVTTGSRFYSPAEMLSKLLSSAIKENLNNSAVRNIDPKGICIDTRPLDVKRILAVKYIKKYKSVDKFMRDLFFKLRRFPLTEKQCDAAIKTGKAMDDYEKHNDNIVVDN